MKTLQRDGIQGLFRGLPAVLCRDVPFNFFFFGMYEAHCTAMRVMIRKPEHDDLPAWMVLVAGGLAGVSGWSVVFPMDVVKSRLQINSGNDGVLSTCAKIYSDHGIRGFYNGWSAAVLRAFPANGALFMGYELCNRVFRYLDG